METANVYLTKKATSKTVWAGRIIHIVCVLFLLLDAIMKVIQEVHSMEGSVKVGWPAHYVQPLGIVLLVCTILYAIPRTAFTGALLLTAYLGGATAIMARTGEPFFFPVIFGVLVWVGLCLREPSLRHLLLLRK